MIKTKKIVGLLVLVLTTYSCTVYKKVALPPQNGIQGVNADNKTSNQLEIGNQNTERLKVYSAEKEFIKNSDDLNWGLALSGGGVRSAVYNFGALKALYDLDLLDKMQIISSVSGGGYLSYSLYTNYYHNKDAHKAFGYFTFDNGIYLKKVCEQQNKANFMPNAKYFLAFFNTPKGAFNIYQNKIEYAFGNKTPSGLKITTLNKEIKNGSIPYFIINTTLAGSNASDWLSRNLELTPLYYGNPEVDFTPWGTHKVMPWSEATTISGAALKFKLLRKVGYSGDKIPITYLPLSDGGHSENLAAISLIRRGVKNIIIIDAEYNKDYSFDGYVILKNQLKKELNLDLKINSIDNFLKEKSSNKNVRLENSVHQGTVGNIPLGKDTLLAITIYYVKMSMSKDIVEKIKNKEVINAGNTINTHLKKQACTTYDKKGNCNYYSCDKLTGFEDTNLNDLASFWVQSYSTFLNNHKKWKRLGYTFPHTTTVDQSFYRNQLAAFVGLGYLQALKLKEFIIE